MADRQKSVMLYCNSLHKGGAERVFAQLAERFAGLGWRSVLVTSYADPGREEYPLSARVTRYNMEPVRRHQGFVRRNLSRIAALRALCKREKPDILISCMQEPNFRAMIATAGLPVKRLVSVCNAAEKEYPGLGGFVTGRLLMPMAEGCVFQTEEERRWFPKRLQKKGRIIMNQVSDAFFAARHEGARRDFVSVGRLTGQKNQALLIRAFARIAGETEERLRLYGAGELHEDLQALIDALGLHGRVQLMGLSADVANDIKDARAFVLSSDYEGLPNALLEAMALGLPCIASDCPCGGPAELIEQGKTGLLFPVGDEAALTACLRELLDDADKRGALAEAARLRAEAFRPGPVFAGWENYVRSVIDGKERP